MTNFCNLQWCEVTRHPWKRQNNIRMFPDLDDVMLSNANSPCSIRYLYSLFLLHVTSNSTGPLCNGQDIVLVRRVLRSRVTS